MLLSGQLTVGDIVRHLLTLPQDAPVAISTEDYLAASAPLQYSPILQFAVNY